MPSRKKGEGKGGGNSNRQNNDDKPNEFQSEMPVAEMNKGAGGSTLEHERHTYIQEGQGAPVFNPFEGVARDDSIKTQAGMVGEVHASGQIDDETALQALDNAYKAKHSMGHDVLDDRRLKPTTRVKRYVAWIASLPVAKRPEGQKTEAEARKYAIQRVSSQGEDIAGKWSTISHDVDIRQEKGE